MSHRSGWDSEDVATGSGIPKFLDSLDQNHPQRVFSKEFRNIGISRGEVFSTDFRMIGFLATDVALDFKDIPYPIVLRNIGI